MKDQKSVLLHPVRMRIIQNLMRQGRATAGRLSEAMPDISRTTLYRHINLLAGAGYLVVTKEEKRRGTYEKEYAVNLEGRHGDSIREQQKKDTSALLLKLLGDFEEYYGREEGSPERDMLFASSNTLALSDREFEGFLREMFQVIEKYLSLPDQEGRRLRSVALISSPAWESEKTEEKEKGSL